MSIRRKVLVAREGEIRDGSSSTFAYGPRKGIAVNRDGTLRAYVNACTHMGGTTELCGNVLRCRMHQAEFDPATGERLAGQAPEGTRLAPIDVFVEDGNVYAMLELHDDFS